MAFEILPPSSSSEGPSRSSKFQKLPNLAFQLGEKPHSMTAEQSLLASVLFRSEALLEVQDVLADEKEFFLPAHQEIYKAMLELSAASIPIDTTTLVSRLKERGKLEIIGGEAYIAEIAQVPAVFSNAQEYAKIISDLAWRRRLLESTQEAHGKVYTAGPTNAVAREIERMIFAATQEKKEKGHLATLKDIVGDAITNIERRAEGTADMDFALTGLTDLDETLGGMRPGQLIVIAAGPGSGKTALALNIMSHVTMNQGKTVLFFSLEMSHAEVVERVLAFTASIDSDKIRKGSLQPKDFDDLYHAAEELEKASLYIDDRSTVTPFEVLAQSRQILSRLHLEGKSPKIDLIVVDYIQIMKSGSPTENRALEVGAITGGLKMLAKELKVPVLALSQLNRERSKRTGTDKKPQLSDLKDSGSIEADADCVIFIHHEYGPENDSRNPHESELIVAKQRSGPTRNIKVTWLGHLTRFTDYIQMDDNYGPPPEASY